MQLKPHMDRSNLSVCKTCQSNFLPYEPSPLCSICVYGAMVFEGQMARLRRQKTPHFQSVMSLTENYAIGWDAENTMTQLSVMLNWALYFNAYRRAMKALKWQNADFQVFLSALPASPRM